MLTTPRHTTPTPAQINGYCRDLAERRRELAKSKSHTAALAVQKATHKIDTSVRELRASFKLLAGGMR